MSIEDVVSFCLHDWEVIKLDAPWHNRSTDIQSMLDLSHMKPDSFSSWLFFGSDSC